MPGLVSSRLVPFREHLVTRGPRGDCRRVGGYDSHLDVLVSRSGLRRHQADRDPVGEVVGPLSGTTLSPAARLGVVEAPAEIVPAAPVAAVENRSTCRRDLQGAAMTITIPDISYSCPVYAGGQAMLNSGAATQISDEDRVVDDSSNATGAVVG